MIDQNQKDDEDYDNSEELILFLKPYLFLFEIEKFYYYDAYGILLREKQHPFRVISIYRHYLTNEYEVCSHQIHDDDSYSKIYSFNGSKLNCITLARKIILGFDQMYSLSQEIKFFKMGKKKIR